MAGRKRAGRRAYLDNFHRTPAGDYIYTGSTYSLRGDRRRAMVRLAVPAAAAVACEVAGGCFPAPGNGRCFYVILPYAAALIACVMAAWAVGRLIAGGEQVREYVYDATVKKLPGRARAAAALAAATGAGEAVYLLLHGPEGMAAGAAAYLLCQGAAAGSMAALRRAARGLDYRENT